MQLLTFDPNTGVLKTGIDIETTPLGIVVADYATRHQPGGPRLLFAGLSPIQPIIYETVRGFHIEHIAWYTHVPEQELAGDTLGGLETFSVLGAAKGDDGRFLIAVPRDAENPTTIGRYDRLAEPGKEILDGFPISRARLALWKHPTCDQTPVFLLNMSQGTDDVVIDVHGNQEWILRGTTGGVVVETRAAYDEKMARSWSEP